MGGLRTKGDNRSTYDWWKETSKEEDLEWLDSLKEYLDRLDEIAE